MLVAIAPGCRDGDGDAGALELLGEAARGEHVGQLGAAVGLHDRVAVLEAEVVEVHGPRVVGLRRREHDAGRSALDQPVAEQRGEQEAAEVVDRERRLDAVGGQAATRANTVPALLTRTSIRSQVVEHVVGQPAYGVLVGEVAQQGVDAARRLLGPDPADRGGGPVGAAADEDDPAAGVGGRDLARALQPDAVAAAGDHVGLHGWVIRSTSRASSSCCLGELAALDVAEVEHGLRGWWRRRPVPAWRSSAAAS